MAQNDDDNTSVSSNEDAMETQEARAMQAQLENMKQIERQQKSLSISMSHGSHHSPRGIPSIVPMGSSGTGAPFQSGITVVTPPTVSTVNAMNTMNTINTSGHNRNNSNPHLMQQMGPLQPRLSNSSAHSHGSRNAPFNTHNQNIQQFHPQNQQMAHQNVYSITPNSYSMQNGGAPRTFFQVWKFLFDLI